MSPRARRLGALGVFAVALAVLIGASRTQGNVRDEGYYFDAAEEYAAWYVDLIDDTLHGKPGRELSRSGVDRGFNYNHEHPALMKTLFGLSWRLFHKCRCPEQAGLHPIRYHARHHTLGLLDEETAFRLPTMVLTAAMIAIRTAISTGSPLVRPANSSVAVMAPGPAIMGMASGNAAMLRACSSTACSA